MARFKRQVLQSTLVMLCTLVVFFLLQGMHWPLVASTSVASSAFVLFAMPESESARVWNTVGGNVLGLISGLLIVALGHALPMPDAVSFALTVGLAMWIMLICRAAHPPAAGAALTVPLEATHGGFGFAMAGSILLSVVLLVLLQRLLLRMRVL